MTRSTRFACTILLATLAGGLTACATGNGPARSGPTRNVIATSGSAGDGAPRTHDRRPRADQPNIVLLFADDLGYGDLSSYGHPTIRTPHLDRLAAEGMRFTSFYSASPACTQARAALLTGRYSVRCGLPHVIMPADDAGLPAAEITLAEALREIGYRTAAIGKWHLGHMRAEQRPRAHGFDSYFGLLYSNDMMPPWVNTERPLELWRDDTVIEHPVDQDTLTQRYTDEAVRFIDDCARSDKPFFLYLAHSMPHVPLHVSPDSRGTSRAGLYGDVVEEIDRSTGDVLDALQRNGIVRDTIVVFTSDNGPWRAMPDRMFQEDKVKPWDAGSVGPLRGSKGMTYEGGQRVPAIVRWPGVVPAAAVTADVASTLDLLPTLVRIAGGQPPADRVIDGRDIRGMLEGGRVSSTPFYYFRNAALEAVRDGRWKLRRSNHQRGDVVAGAAVTSELYDLDTDPSERWDRSADMPHVVTRLEALLREFADELRRTAR